MVWFKTIWMTRNVNIKHNLRVTSHQPNNSSLLHIGYFMNTRKCDRYRWYLASKYPDWHSKPTTMNSEAYILSTAPVEIARLALLGPACRVSYKPDPQASRHKKWPTEQSATVTSSLPKFAWIEPQQRRLSVSTVAATSSSRVPLLPLSKQLKSATPPTHTQCNLTIKHLKCICLEFTSSFPDGFFKHTAIRTRI